MQGSRTPGYLHSGQLGMGYQSDAGEALFRGTNGIVHELNALGFRDMGDAHAADPSAVRIAAVGCSYVFGYGVDLADTWLSKFADLVTLVFARPTHCLNLGLPGASIDYVVRQLTELEEAFAPHIVLVSFPQKERVEHWSSPGTCYAVRPGSPRNPRWSQGRLDLQEAIEQISGRANDFRRLYQAARTATAFCRAGKSLLLYTYASVTDTPSSEEWAPGANYIGMPFPKLDLAADGLHPGAKSNSHLALKSFARLCAWLETEDEASARARTALGLGEASETPAAALAISRGGDLSQWKSPA